MSEIGAINTNFNEAYNNLIDAITIAENQVADYPFVKVRTVDLKLILQKVKPNLTFQKVIGSNDAFLPGIVVDIDAEIP